MIFRKQSKHGVTRKKRKKKKGEGERESYESTGGVHLILMGVDERFQMVFHMQELISMLCFKVLVEAGLGKTMENDIRSQLKSQEQNTKY